MAAHLNFNRGRCSSWTRRSAARSRALTWSHGNLVPGAGATGQRIGPGSRYRRSGPALRGHWLIRRNLGRGRGVRVSNMASTMGVWPRRRAALSATALSKMALGEPPEGRRSLVVFASRRASENIRVVAVVVPAPQGNERNTSSSQIPAASVSVRHARNWELRSGSSTSAPRQPSMHS